MRNGPKVGLTLSVLYISRVSIRAGPSTFRPSTFMVAATAPSHPVIDPSNAGGTFAGLTVRFAKTGGNPEVGHTAPSARTAISNQQRDVDSHTIRRCRSGVGGRKEINRKKKDKIFQMMVRSPKPPKKTGENRQLSAIQHREATSDLARDRGGQRNVRRAQRDGGLSELDGDGRDTVLGPARHLG